jgi:acetylornithine deacetylase/succinyl-diaminopimelate desuccinylase family protein
MAPASADLSPLIDGDRVVDRLRKLVASPSENPPGNEADVARLVSEMCDDLGLDVSFHEMEQGRPSVIARWIGTAGPTVAYCSHIDTVPVGDLGLWSVDPFEAAMDGGVMHGRGACDAKGPITAALEAVTVLKQSGFEPAGTLELELVADEESMGLKGAGYLVAAGIVSPDAVIVGEPTSLRVVRAQRGACWFRINTRGVASHGSAPERGVNAIRHMSEIVLRLDETLPDVTHPVLGGPSIGVGTISGGAKVNVVPAACMIEVDRRSVPGESREQVIESVEAAVELAKRRFPDLDASVELAFYGEPFEVDEGAEVVAAASAAVADATGSPAQVVGFRGASDARFFAQAGAEVIVLGPGDIGVAHTARESIELRQVEAGALAYALAFARLLG